MLHDPRFVEGSSLTQDHDSVWAEPSNNNPLEKVTMAREGFTKQSKAMKDEEEVCTFDRSASKMCRAD